MCILWWGRGDLNPQGFLHSILSAARLPVSPRPQTAEILHHMLFFSSVFVNKSPNLKIISF